MTTQEALARPAEHPTVTLLDLIESPLNPRKKFDATALEELAASLTAMGVLVPLLVRPNPGMAGIGLPKFEVIAGARRLRAAKLAGVVNVPVVVRQMTDREALEAMLTENVQRNDLHPLEEAEGFFRLKEMGVPVEEIADRLGKKERSRRDIYNTLALRELSEKVKDAFGENAFNKSIALVLAGIGDEKMQVQALADYVSGSAKGMTVRDFREWVRTHYMLDLNKAPFDRADAELVPAAGACFGCPYRTGTKPDLFEGVGKDFCTKPPCYADKAEAAWAQKVEERKAVGLKVLDPADAKAVFEATGVLKYESGYRRADEQCDDDPKRRTWKQLLGKTARGELILARSPKGDELELLVKEGLREKLIALGHEFWKDEAKKTAKAASKSGAAKKSSSADDDVPDAEVAKRARERAIREALVRQAVVARLISAVEKAGPSKELWRALIQECLDAGASNYALERRFGKDEDPKAMQKWLGKAGEPQLCGLTFELVLESALYESTNTKTLKELCKLYKVDEGEVRAEVKAAVSSAPVPRNEFRAQLKEREFSVVIQPDDTLQVTCQRCPQVQSVALTKDGDVEKRWLTELLKHADRHDATAKKKGGR